MAEQKPPAKPALQVPPSQQSAQGPVPKPGEPVPVATSSSTAKKG